MQIIKLMNDPIGESRRRAAGEASKLTRAALVFVAMICCAEGASARYLQADPMGLDGGWNRVSYAEGNPLRYGDPYGLCPMCLIPALPYVGELAAVGAAWWASQNTYQAKTPSTGDPGEWHANPGNGQERLFGSNGRPAVDIDWHPDHGAGRPHGHNWDENGKRGPGVPLSPWPQGRTPEICRSK
jgi:hypothetical protein